MLKLSCGKPSITKVLTAPVNDLEPQERVPVLAYLDLGISPEWPYIKAAEAVKNLNKTNSVEKEKIRNAAKRTVEYVSLNENLFPPELMAKFKEKLEEENFGSDEHLKKLYSHFNFIQRMVIELRLDARDYKDSAKKIYKYFILQKISVNYSGRVLSLLNRWGCICRKRAKSVF